MLGIWTSDPESENMLPRPRLLIIHGFRKSYYTEVRNIDTKYIWLTNCRIVSSKQLYNNQIYYIIMFVQMACCHHKNNT